MEGGISNKAIICIFAESSEDVFPSNFANCFTVSMI